MDRRLFEMREFELQKSVVSWLTRSFLPTRMPNITTEEFQSIQNIAMTIENNTIDWSIPYIEQGREQGLEQGREQGLKEGEANGERRAFQVMLKKQLARKFGPLSSDLISQIDSAEMDLLEKLVEEILDIESIDEVGRFLNLTK
jgi:flagellar biosynthesis/type III secretory pathway protein FliH